VQNFMNIGDEKITSIGIKGLDENFACLRELGFRIDESRSEISSRSDHFTKVRESVARRLEVARAALPPGIDFLIKEGYRALSHQEESYTFVLNYFRENYPDFSDQRVVEETNKLCAPVHVAPHPTGAAVDLTLWDTRLNREMDLGTKYNANPHETDNATFLHAVNISPEAAANRRILQSVMEGAGFVCYPSEWWHWSYGDRYWAFVRGEGCALYSPVDETIWEG